MPEARSVTTGVWVGVGSRDESDELAGASHFLEHLLFKGTDTRSARSIAVAVDSVGGEMNAFTTREHTAFYTRLPVDHLDFGLELLTDVVSRPAFRASEIDAEREVILEELLMSEDAPDDLVGTKLYEALFPRHPLGRETLGTEQTIEAMTRDVIAGFHGRHYRPANLVVAAAGDLDHQRVVEAVAGFLAEGDPGTPPVREAPGDEIVPLTVVERPIEQVHVAFGWRSMHYDDPDRYALWVANQVLGGGMSSRLFQEVREERGLAYTVFSAPSTYRDSGATMIYAGTAPARLHELIDVIDTVIDDLLTDGITADEHRTAVGCIEGSMLLGLEDSGSRMSRLGTGEVTRGEVIPVDEQLARIRAVTPDDANRVLRRVLGAPRAVAAVGPVTERDLAGV
jgi:predicted Zn-dependent peptidase